MTFKGHSRSSETSRFNMISYYRSVVTTAVFVSFRIYSQILVENREIYVPTCIKLSCMEPHSNIAKIISTGKSRMMGQPAYC